MTLGATPAQPDCAALLEDLRAADLVDDPTSGVARLPAGGREAFRRAFERDKDDAAAHGRARSRDPSRSPASTRRSTVTASAETPSRPARPRPRPDELGGAPSAALGGPLDGIEPRAAVLHLAQLRCARGGARARRVGPGGRQPPASRRRRRCSGPLRRAPCRSASATGTSAHRRPLAARLPRGRWYLTATTTAARAERGFRLDRIEGGIGARRPRRLRAPAGRRPGCARSRGSWGGSDARHRPRASSTPTRRRGALRHLGAATASPTSATTARSSSCCAVTNRDAFRSFVLGFLDHAEVLEPPELRAEVVVGWLTAGPPVGPDGPCRARHLADDRLRRLLAIVPWVAANDGPNARRGVRPVRRTAAELLADARPSQYCAASAVHRPTSSSRWRSRATGCGSSTPTSSPAPAAHARGGAGARGPGRRSCGARCRPRGPLAAALAKLAAVLGVDPAEAIDVSWARCPAGRARRVSARRVAERRQVELDYYAYGRDARSARIVDPCDVVRRRGRVVRAGVLPPGAGPACVPGRPHRATSTCSTRRSTAAGRRANEPSLGPRSRRSRGSSWSSGPGPGGWPSTYPMDRRGRRRGRVAAGPHGGDRQRPWLERLLAPARSRRPRGGGRRPAPSRRARRRPPDPRPLPRRLSPRRRVVRRRPGARPSRSQAVTSTAVRDMPTPSGLPGDGQHRDSSEEPWTGRAMPPRSGPRHLAAVTPRHPDAPTRGRRGDELDAHPDHGFGRNVVEWVAVVAAAPCSSRCWSRRSSSRRSASRRGRWCPTLEMGDRVLVNKLSYSCTTCTVVTSSCSSGRPRRPGPQTTSRTSSSGSSAVPGDTVESRDGVVYVDGRAARRALPRRRARRPRPPDDRGARGPRVRDGRQPHELARTAAASGPIDEDTIVGRAFVKVLPLSDIGWL